MKRKIIAVILLLCLSISLATAEVTAAGTVYFTAIDNELHPLDDNTMPTFINGLLYIPYTFFSSDKLLGVYFAAGSDRVMLYSSKKNLTFDFVKATVFDQDGTQSYIPAQKQNGLIYVPVEAVCRFFGLQYQYLSGGLAPVVRFTKDSFNINGPTFVGLNRKKMQDYYNAYTGSTDASLSSPAPSPEDPTYENVTVFLSFCGLAPVNFSAVLDALDIYGYKCCFFVSADDIAASADLIRRAAGSGHTIGIWLNQGTFDEYERASALLFEAAKLRTVIVSAYDDVQQEALSMADTKGLVLWSPSSTYDELSKFTVAGVTGNLSVQSGSRESLNIACTDTAASLMRSILAYMSEKKYTVQCLSERTLPTYFIG